MTIRHWDRLSTDMKVLDDVTDYVSSFSELSENDLII